MKLDWFYNWFAYISFESEKFNLGEANGTPLLLNYRPRVLTVSCLQPPRKAILPHPLRWRSIRTILKSSIQASHILGLANPKLGTQVMLESRGLWHPFLREKAANFPEVSRPEGQIPIPNQNVY